MHDIDPGNGWMPLTLPQLDFWEEFLFHPDQPLSTVAHCLEIDGEVDQLALLQAIAQSAREAEVLSIRFRIPAEGEAPLQRCEPDLIPTPDYVDLREFPNPLAEARRRMDLDVAAKLDLRTDMLSTQALYRIGAKRYLWYSRAHHIIVDGYGLALIEQRCGQLYRHYRGAEEPGSPFHPFASFIEEETAYRESARWHADRAYWTNYLAQEIPVSVLDKSNEDYGGGGHHSDDKLEDEVFRSIWDLASSIDLGWPDALNLLTGAYLYHGLSPEEGGGGTRLTLWLPFMSRWGSVGAYTPAMLVNILPSTSPATRRKLYWIFWRATPWCSENSGSTGGFALSRLRPIEEQGNISVAASQKQLRSKKRHALGIPSCTLARQHGFDEIISRADDPDSHAFAFPSRYVSAKPLLFVEVIAGVQIWHRRSTIQA